MFLGKIICSVIFTGKNLYFEHRFKKTDKKWKKKKY